MIDIQALSKLFDCERQALTPVNLCYCFAVFIDIFVILCCNGTMNVI